MKGIKFFILAFFIIQCGYSQTEKLLHGKISGNGSGIQGVDVINYTTQKSTVTNGSGVFYILAKANDVILIHHKKYLQQKIILSQKDVNEDNFNIALSEKPTQLEEVIVDSGTSTGIRLTQAEIDAMKLLKDQSQAKVLGINDGSIPYGMDLVRIGKGAYDLIKKAFKSDNKESKGDVKTELKKYVASNIKQDFFIKHLKLSPTDIPLFLDFCGEDAKSEKISNHPNVLTVMDFLFAKNVEFQKLLTLVK